MRVVGFLLAVLALVAAGCGSGSGMEEATPPPPPPAETTPSPGAANRPAAPPVAGATLDGEEIALADFRGKPVFVNVWSSW